MVVLKRVNWLVLMGLVAVFGAGTNAFAQTLSSVRVGLNIEGVRFVVDGQQFSSTQNFVWPAGSNHVIVFPLTTEPDGTESTFQYTNGRDARYAFGGWAVSGTNVLVPAGGTVQTLVADPSVTQVLGTVTMQYPLSISFVDGSPDNNNCAATVPFQNITRQGVLFLDNLCYANNQIVWVSPGSHQVAGYAYPGFAFAGMIFGNQPIATSQSFVINVVSANTIGPLFVPAKRIRFSTSPPGLGMLVDRAPITTSPVYTDIQVPVNYNGTDCVPDYSRIPVQTPVGVPPLCAGDFDFIPNSSHQIGAPESQTDGQGNYWVFDHFSNGQGQNSTIVASGDTRQIDQIQAVFVRGVQSAIITSVNGLKVEVDGRSNWPGPTYGFIWGEGQIHHIKALLTQTDTKGRVWKFTGWSDKGDVEHDVSVPKGSFGFSVTAFFQLQGQVKLTSTPPGMKISVSGADCTTPCTFNQDEGTKLSLLAPTTIPFGETSRYDFDTWTGGTNNPALDVTFTSDVQTINAQYHGSFLIATASDPDNGATFQFTPASTDGFVADGTNLQITVTPKTGFKLIKWGGDVSGTFQTTRLKVSGPSSVIVYLDKVPAIAPAGIRNAAGTTPDNTVAPGSIISIYGEHLSDALQIGPSNPLAQAIGATYVTVNDSLLPLILVAPQQINAQLPSSLADGSYILQVHQLGKADVSAAFTVRRNSPGIYYNVMPDGMPLVAALHEDGTPVSPDSPATRGETISFFGTGLGPYDRPVIDGFVTPSAQIYQIIDPVKVLADIPAPPTPGGAAPADAAPPVVRDPNFAGGAAGMVGTSVIKLTVDPDLPAGNVLELFLSVNGVQSNRVQLPVK